MKTYKLRLWSCLKSYFFRLSTCHVQNFEERLMIFSLLELDSSTVENWVQNGMCNRSFPCSDLIPRLWLSDWKKTLVQLCSLTMWCVSSHLATMWFSPAPAWYQHSNNLNNAALSYFSSSQAMHDCPSCLLLVELNLTQSAVNEFFSEN